MNADSFIKGMQRANANRLRRQQVEEQQANAVNVAAKQQQTNTATNKSVLTESSPVHAASPMFDLEAFRLDIIRKAIAKIMFNKQKEMK